MKGKRQSRRRSDERGRRTNEREPLRGYESVSRLFGTEGEQKVSPMGTGGKRKMTCYTYNPRTPREGVSGALSYSRKAALHGPKRAVRKYLISNEM